MNNDSSRICNKCKKSLDENEAYCTYCGTLSGKPKKGTIIIRPERIKLVAITFLVIGILLLITGVILILVFKDVVAILFGLAISCITIGIALIKANNQFVNTFKEKNVPLSIDTNHKHCEYCSTVIEDRYIYCYLCGSKIK